AYGSRATQAPRTSCPKTYPLGRPHWLPAFSTISASPRETVPKNRCPASMTSFEEYCPLCGGGLLARGGLLAGGGPLAGGGYACAIADSVPQGTRARTRRVVRIRVCIACCIRGKALQRSPTPTGCVSFDHSFAPGPLEFSVDGAQKARP